MHHQRLLRSRSVVRVLPSHHLKAGQFSTCKKAHMPPPPPDSPSLVKSFLYGTEKGQLLQKEMEQSYSKILARGKYVHKLNQHHVKPDKINEYLALMSLLPALHSIRANVGLDPKHIRKLQTILKIMSIS